MPHSCTLSIDRTDSGYLFRVVGRGTLRESPAVRDFVCGAIEDGADVVLDLNECEHLDSTFQGCLVICHQRSGLHKGSFAVLADEGTRRKLLATARLHKILAFADERPDCSGNAVTLDASDLERTEFCQHLLETHRRLAELGGPAAETFHRIAEQLQKELDDIST